jgi:hypothetical protein
MKRILLLIYIILFLAVCILPTALMAAGVQSVNRENRSLAQMPALLDDGKPNLGFPKQFESYFSDNFGLRQGYVTAWNALNTYGLGTSPDTSVIAGRDGWLFYGDEAHDYLGRNVLSDADVFRIRRTLELEQEYLSSKGIAFVFTVAPNKSTLYGQYMPARYEKSAGPSNLSELALSLASSGVTYADLYSALQPFTNGTQLYLKKDSHWNNLGALIGYRAIMDAANRAGLGVSYDLYSNASYKLQQNWDGDLEAMLLPAFNDKDWQAAFNIGQNFKYAQRPRSMEDMRIATSSNANTKRLLMFRDSFANALIPLLSNNFGYACYMRAVPYDFTALEQEKPEVVIEEIVERNIPNLLQTAPVMPAPQRALNTENAVPTDAGTDIEVSDQGTMLKINGWISPEIANGGDGTIYLEFRNESGSRVYEPFPIGEGAPPDGFGAGAKGFTMYIDKDALPSGSYQVNLLSASNGALQSIETGKSVLIG